MGFNEDLKQLAERVVSLRESISTEEATKMSMILPFFQLLGYDVFNPSEFCPEYTADIGVKKGEKVDYAILIDNTPQILIECKWCGESLSKHGSQLFRYFGTSQAKFGILTNGLTYQFFTDLDEVNKMDLTPFLEIHLDNLKDAQINELKKFSKEIFDKESIFSTASDLKYSSLIKNLLASDIEEPSDDFVRYILSNVYEGQKNQKVIDKFKPIIKKSFTGFINDIVNQKISSALTPEDDVPAAEPTLSEPKSKIITTEEELEAFYIIRGILAGTIPVENIVYRDTESYFGILYKDNNRKPICRINLDTKNKQLLIPDADKNFERIYIQSLNDIYSCKSKLVAVAKRYQNQ